MLAAASALVLTYPAATAEARVGREFFGVQAWDTPSQAEFQTLKGAGIGTFRVNLLWSVVEPTRGLRNWGPYDDLVSSAARSGMRILPVILGSPSFAAKKYQYPPRPGRARRAYVSFVKDLVARYGHKGQFWRAAGSGLPYLPIKAWQVWNEPNFPSYWYEKPNARQYAGLLRDTRRAIKSRDRSATIVLGGLPQSTSGVPIAKYLSSLYRVNGIKKYFDVVAVHPYARSAAGIEGELKRVRGVMGRYHDSRTPIWVTESGWSTGGPSGVFTTSPAGQASKLKQTLQRLLKHRQRYRLGLYSWFSLRDRGLYPGERNWWAPYTGLFDRSGSPKPAWYVYLSFTGGK